MIPQNIDMQMQIRNLEREVTELKLVIERHKEFIKAHIEPAIRGVVKCEITRLLKLIADGTFKISPTDKENLIRVARITVEDEFRKYIGGDWIPPINIPPPEELSPEDSSNGP